MSKYVHYFLLLTVFILATGCETIKGTTCGFKKDVHNVTHNASDSSKNGWNAIEKVDAWMRENMW
jgi:hypothetical protein